MTVGWLEGPRGLRVELDSRGRWHGPAELHAVVWDLTRFVRPGGRGPARGDPLVAQLEDGAARLGDGWGVVLAKGFPPAPASAGVVY